MMHDRYPLFLDLGDRDVLVVGGGQVAERRVAGLLTAGARIVVIAPTISEALARLADSSRLTWLERVARGADVTGGPAGIGAAGARWWLVHTATGHHETDTAVAAAAEAAGIWCVRADQATESTAHTPAVTNGPDGVQVAVCGGGDPGRAKALRNAISLALGSGSLPLRRTRKTGRVILVGGGPGDAGLITVSGRQWLAQADVVVTDRLGPVALLDELDDGVEIIDVGKAAGHHPIPQERINAILVEHAKRGATVVRLKGGDPFVMGRGGEEALHCLENDVPVSVVPGVTSAVAVPALAGIPVTHRGVASSFVVASAHAGAGDAIHAAAAAPPDATLVLLMGLSALERTSTELIRSGRKAETPVAVISAGSMTDQQVVTATLATIADAATRAALPSPALVVVGEVVRLRATLAKL